eukprot:5597978-Pleurochrysis_carterae.AAC.1
MLVGVRAPICPDRRSRARAVRRQPRRPLRRAARVCPSGRCVWPRRSQSACSSQEGKPNVRPTANCCRQAIPQHCCRGSDACKSAMPDGLEQVGAQESGGRPALLQSAPSRAARAARAGKAATKCARGQLGALE